MSYEPNEMHQPLLSETDTKARKPATFPLSSLPDVLLVQVTPFLDEKSFANLKTTSRHISGTEGQRAIKARGDDTFFHTKKNTKAFAQPCIDLVDSVNHECADILDPCACLPFTLITCCIGHSALGSCLLTAACCGLLGGSIGLAQDAAFSVKHALRNDPPEGFIKYSSRPPTQRME